MTKYTRTTYPTGYVMLEDGTVVRSGPIWDEFQKKFSKALERAARETLDDHEPVQLPLPGEESRRR